MKEQIDKYTLTDEKEKNIWENGIFVFDSSALLNFYEYSNETLQDIFKTTFEILKGRLWIPFHVNYEYLKNREITFKKPIKLYNDLKNINLKTISEQLNQLINRTKKQNRHPVLFQKPIINFQKKFNEFEKSVLDEINIKITEIENTASNDFVFNSFLKYFEVGKDFSYSQVINIIKEGEFRYKYSIPPGYKDQDDKIGFQIFGDLIIWKQILEYAKSKNKPIALITDDLKEDWWVLQSKNNPIKPREELIDEIYDYAKIPFWMYSSSLFLEKSKKFLNSELQEKALKEIKSVYESEVYIQNINISANREAEEPWRIERLKNVAKFVFNKFGNLKIAGLYDHKGDLTVTWEKQPSDIEMEYLGTAWEEENELAENVKHIIKHD